MSHLNHLHLLVTAWVDNPPMTADAGTDWLRELVDIIDMQILMDATAIFCEDLGNEGVTGIVGLTTSHASFHSWHDAPRPFISFDLYSCRHFAVEKVFEHLAKWGLMKCNYVLIDRDPSHATMQIIDQGIFTPEA
jgi:S-adenosylmethionine/arginine decarboxylase-like enzyme